MLGIQPSARSRLTSRSVRGVPSGLVVSHTRGPQSRLCPTETTAVRLRRGAVPEPDRPPTYPELLHMTKAALITGITGQDGSYLAGLLPSDGYVVHGIRRKASTLISDQIDHVYHDAHDGDPKLVLHHEELSDGVILVSLVRDIEPDEVYKLGAQRHVKVSFEMPEYTGDVAGVVTIRLLKPSKSPGSAPSFTRLSRRRCSGPPRRRRMRTGPSTRAARTGAANATPTGRPSTTARRTGSTPAMAFCSTTRAFGVARRS